MPEPSIQQLAAEAWRQWKRHPRSRALPFDDLHHAMARLGSAVEPDPEGGGAEWVPNREHADRRSDRTAFDAVLDALAVSRSVPDDEPGLIQRGEGGSGPFRVRTTTREGDLARSVPDEQRDLIGALRGALSIAEIHLRQLAMEKTGEQARFLVGIADEAKHVLTLDAAPVPDEQRRLRPEPTAAEIERAWAAYCYELPCVPPVDKHFAGGFRSAVFRRPGPDEHRSACCHVPLRVWCPECGQATHAEPGESARRPVPDEQRELDAKAVRPVPGEQSCRAQQNSEKRADEQTLIEAAAEALYGFRPEGGYVDHPRRKGVREWRDLPWGKLSDEQKAGPVLHARAALVAAGVLPTEHEETDA